MKQSVWRVVLPKRPKQFTKVIQNILLSLQSSKHTEHTKQKLERAAVTSSAMAGKLCILSFFLSFFLSLLSCVGVVTCVDVVDVVGVRWQKNITETGGTWWWQ